MDLHKLTTEKRNPRSANIDEVNTLEICEIINREDETVAGAVKQAITDIALAVDIIVEALRSGGRLFYMGAGTSGRLGILDAVECPPTYSTDFEMIQGLIAGGYEAIFRAKEGAEDSRELGKADLQAKGLNRCDVVVGIAASGRTPYVLGGLAYANDVGARTIGLACTADSALKEVAGVMIEVVTGPEVVTGSTRMKAGTAQKMVLNMLTTAAMIKLGKTYGNLMVDVKATNEKLQQRAVNIIREVTDCDEKEAKELLKLSGGKVKPAIAMYYYDLSPEKAADLLAAHNGSLKSALKK